MDLVHESIHAWLDIRMPKVRSIGTAAMKGMLTTTKATDEAVAYLGGILFYIYDNTPSGSKPTIPADWNNSIFIEAWRIAVSIMSRPGAVVSAKDVASLKKIIMDDPNYSDIKDDPTSNYGNDGV